MKVSSFFILCLGRIYLSALFGGVHCIEVSVYRCFTVTKWQRWPVYSQNIRPLTELINLQNSQPHQYSGLMIRE